MAYINCLGFVQLDYSASVYDNAKVAQATKLNCSMWLADFSSAKFVFTNG
jgi:hypothetical protein